MKRILYLLLLITNISLAQSGRSKILNLLESGLKVKNIYYMSRDSVSSKINEIVPVYANVKSVNGTKYSLYTKYKPDSLLFQFNETSLIGCSWYFTIKIAEDQSLEQFLIKDLLNRPGTSIKGNRREYYWEDAYSRVGIVTWYDNPKNFELIFKFFPQKAGFEDPKTTERDGKGNGTFIPDVNSATQVLLANKLKKDFESLLPSFTVIDSFSVSHKYNEGTKEHDIIDEVSSKYVFSYKSTYSMIVILGVAPNGKIKSIEYTYPDGQYFYDFEQQRLSLGYNYDKTMSEFQMKMGTGTFKEYKNSSGFFLSYRSNRNLKIYK